MELPRRLDFARLQQVLDSAIASDRRGTVVSVGSNRIAVAGLPIPMGSICRVESRHTSSMAQVIGIDGHQTLMSPYDGPAGIAPGNRVRFIAAEPSIPVGEGMLGRVFGGCGEILDSTGAVASQCRQPLNERPPRATTRLPVSQVLATGVKAIDAFTSIGKGQRIGIFAGAGVGKSRLLGMLARGAAADVIVVGLIGERGREVQEFLNRELPEDARQRCVTVVATSDQPALRRIQAAKSATAIAEYFRDQGKDVLLLMDSITRCALAQREVGLASGEAPTTRGFPSSVFSLLPGLIERAGGGCSHIPGCGSITGVYTVLTEGDDPHEPISDTMRGLLDGHIQLSRSIAHAGRYPAIDVLTSLSRLQQQLVDRQHLQHCAYLRNLLAAYKENEDLITVGAYQEGSDARVDEAIAFRPGVESFLKQCSSETWTWEQTMQALDELVQPMPGIPSSDPGKDGNNEPR